MRKLYPILLLAIIAFTSVNGQNLPFPQQVTYEGSIRPNHKTSAELNLALSNLYDSWKADFLKETDLSGGYYVLGECTGCSVESKGTSEGHGYGMIITALMAGYDPMAKTYFDGLYLFFDYYRSTTNKELMNWNVAVDEREPWTGSATDGDMDIAYALLLAHYQWGSTGEINYLDEALDMINKGLKVGDMNTTSKRVMLGDWDSDALSTRPSDWMTGHFNAYAAATQDDFWLQANDSIYAMITQIQSNNSISTGLLPDFVIGDPAKPANPDFLEGPNDGNYYYNACRFPWRIATDYLHYGSKGSKESLAPFIAWAKVKINGDFNNYTAGFTLQGEALNEYTDIAFTAPLVLAFCTDSAYQKTLNTGWDYIEENYYAYFDASINLLSQLLITGNWWAPEESISNNPDIRLEQNHQEIRVNETARISFIGSDTSSITKVTIYQNNKKLTSLLEQPFTYDYLVTKTGQQTLKVMVESESGLINIQQLTINGLVSTSITFSKSGFNSYPNPTNGKLWVEINPTIEVKRFMLFDLTGTCLKQWIPEPGINTYVLDLQELNQGFYLLQIHTFDACEQVKIFKE